MSDPRRSRERARTDNDLTDFDRQSASLLAVLDRDEVLRQVVGRIPEVVGVETGFVGLVGDDGSMSIRHLRGMTTGALNGLRVMPGLGLGGKVLATERPGWVTDYGTASDITHHYDSPVVGEEGIHGVVAVPLYAGERVLGVLYAATHAITDLGDRAADALAVVARDASCALTVAERAQHAAEVAAHEERRRIAMSLHDSVGASLFALTASVRRLGDDVVEFPALRAKLDAIAERASDASAALRASLRALSTPREELVMAVALRATCASFQQRSGVLARLILMDELPDVPQPRSEALVTAAREALLNVEKHAQARSVVVSAFPVRGGLAVAVADDGIGVAAADSDGLGIGLRGVEEQLERVGGTLSLREGEDGGTTVHAWVPT